MAYASVGSAMERWLRADYGWSADGRRPRRKDAAYDEAGAKAPKGAGLLGAVRALLTGTRA